jgi:hypothetical protein
MGPGANGANHFLWFGGGKDKLHVGWRLFHNLQKGIESLSGHHVSLIKNEDFVAIASRSKDSSFS